MSHIGCKWQILDKWDLMMSMIHWYWTDELSHWVWLTDTGLIISHKGVIDWYWTDHLSQGMCLADTVLVISHFECDSLIYCTHNLSHIVWLVDTVIASSLMPPVSLTVVCSDVNMISSKQCQPKRQWHDCKVIWENFHNEYNWIPLFCLAELSLAHSRWPQI